MSCLKYKEFKESIGYKLGCVMINLTISNWSEILSSININDIYAPKSDNSYGYQTRPHITLLYGLTNEVKIDDVKNVFNNISIEDIRIEIGELSIFENELFNVIKYDVNKNDILTDLNKKLSNLPNENEYPEYKPHLTIAYLKKGLGKNYLNKDFVKCKLSDKIEIIYSMPDGEKISIL